jgi:hypothetical protein
MTFQIGMVAADGIIIAGDTRVTNQAGTSRTFSNTSKIVCSVDPPGMYCWSGDCNHEEIANRFLKSLSIEKPEPSLDRIMELGLEAAEEQNSHGWAHQIGAVLIACLSEGKPLLWRIDYAQCVTRPKIIYDKAASGDLLNSAVFFADNYYYLNRPINFLLPLAAHCVLMAGKMNPTGVGGLEAAIWRQSESRPRRLEREEIAALERKSKEDDLKIGRILLAQ